MKLTSKILFIISLLLIATSNLVAQSNLFDREGFFNLILDQKYKINSYYIGGNPAYLNQEVSDERLLVETAFDNQQGEFKPFVMPKDQSNFQLSFTGKKVVSDHGIFKGSAGFNKEIRNNWVWVANKNYERNKTFIYGDSTSGTSRYHSILLNAQYSDELMSNLNFGFSLDYAVDEGLKKVSPKPESEHRDIYLNLGLSYKLDSENSLGLAVKFHDFTEEIDYREDQGAIYDETIILKFTGYDYPSVYNKKVEERRSYTNAYFAVFNFQHHSNNIKAAASFTAGFDKLHIKDGGTDPIPKGFSKNNILIGDAVLLYKLSNNILASLKYQYSSVDFWSKHPDFDVLIMEEETPSQLVNLGIEYLVEETISVGIEGGLRLHEYLMNDYYSDIKADFDGIEYLGKLGIKYSLLNNISAVFGLAYNNNSLSNQTLQYDDVGNYYRNFRKYDLLYKLTSSSSFSGFLKTQFDFLHIGEISLNFTYTHITPKDQIAFEGFNQSRFKAWLQFRREVY